VGHDNSAESKLNKIMKLNSQTNLILKGEIKKKQWEKKAWVKPGELAEFMTRDIISG
jgi:hypothetical protein